VTIRNLPLPAGQLMPIRLYFPSPAYRLIARHPPQEGEPHSVARHVRELRPVRQQSSDDIVLGFIAPAR
jgi:hypothetical protein